MSFHLYLYPQAVLPINYNFTNWGKSSPSQYVFGKIIFCFNRVIQFLRIRSLSNTSTLNISPRWQAGPRRCCETDRSSGDLRGLQLVWMERCPDPDPHAGRSHPPSSSDRKPTPQGTHSPLPLSTAGAALPHFTLCPRLAALR